VDSPPTSTISAPCEMKRRPSSMACAGSRRSPPSEKESGVTLTIAMILGRSSAKPAQLAVTPPAAARGLRPAPGPPPASIVAHDLLATQDRADLVVAERLVLEQSLGDEMQVLKMVGQD